MDFQSDESERIFRRDVFFDNKLGWPKNQGILNTIAQQSDQAQFLRKDGFVAVEIGTISTDVRHMQGIDSVSDRYLIGTNADLTGQTPESSSAQSAFVEMMSSLQGAQRAGRPVIFFGSIGFATVAPSPNLVVDLNQPILFYGANPRSARVNHMLVAISQFVKEHGINAYLYRNNRVESQRFCTSYESLLAQPGNLFAKDSIGFLAEHHPIFIEARIVMDGTVQKENLISHENERQEKDVLDILVTRPHEGQALLKTRIEHMIRAVKTWIEANSRSPKVQAQRQFNLRIVLRGKLGNAFKQDYIKAPAGRTQAPVQEELPRYGLAAQPAGPILFVPPPSPQVGNEALPQALPAPAGPVPDFFEPSAPIPPVGNEGEPPPAYSPNPIEN